jgi:hypothetical protein
VQVRVNQLAEFVTGIANAARIRFFPVAAGNKLGIGKCQGQVCAPLRAKKQLRMGNSPTVRIAYKSLFECFVSRDVFKLHAGQK